MPVSVHKNYIKTRKTKHKLIKIKNKTIKTIKTIGFLLKKKTGHGFKPLDKSHLEKSHPAYRHSVKS